MSKAKSSPTKGTLESVFATVKRCQRKTQVDKTEPIPTPSLSEIQEYAKEIDRWFCGYQFRLETGETYSPRHHGKCWWLLENLSKLTIDVMHSAGCIPMTIHQTVDDHFICLVGFLDEHNWRDSETTHGACMTDNEARLQLSFYNLALPLCLLEDHTSISTINKSTGSTPQAQGDDSTTQPLSENQCLVVKALQQVNPSILSTYATIEKTLDLMDGVYSPSNRTISQIVPQLIQFGYAERPAGPKDGVRLTSKGQKLDI